MLTVRPPPAAAYDLMFDRYKKHLGNVPGISELTPAQFCEVLAAIAEMDPEDYQLGVTKMFLKAGRVRCYPFSPPTHRPRTAHLHSSHSSHSSHS